MQGLDLWRLCDELSIVQAALKAGLRRRGRQGTRRQRPQFRMLSGAVRSKDNWFRFLNTTSMATCAVQLKDRLTLKILRSRWSPCGLGSAGAAYGPAFSSPERAVAQDYLDPKHPRYAPKLAAAVCAWLATDGATSGKSPKQALTKWLREHASNFGLTDDEGKINETGIEEAAKVANWQPLGGAPKTPGG
jgi:hypothetical protein